MTTPGSTTDAELLAFLNEGLATARMAEIERELRDSESLRRHLAGLIKVRDQGTATVGEVWRRQQLSCPARHELGSFLLGGLDAAVMDYIRFHLNTIGCPICQANLDDLERSRTVTPESAGRRQRIFASSVGRLRKNPE